VAVLATPAGNVVVDPLRRGHTEQHVYGGNDYLSLLGMDRYASYAQLYNSQPYLAAAVDRIARGAALLPIKTYRMLNEEGDREPVRGHPLSTLMSRRPRPKMSPIRFKEWMFADLALYGNAVAFITQADDGEPTGIFPVPFPMVEVVGRRDPETYIYQSPLGPIAWDADRVFHLRFRPSNPSNPFIATSPVDTLKRTLTNEDAAARWSTSMFQNAGRPSGFFVTEKNLNEAQTAALRSQAQAIHGGVDNAGKIGVLSGNLSWMQTQMNAVETGLTPLRQWNREEVAAVYNIPPPLLGDLTRATFSNITENKRMFYTGTLPPYLTLFEEEFQAQVIDMTARWGPDLFIEFDMNEMLKGSPKERFETYVLARRIASIDELRKLENWPAFNIPGVTDRPWEPVNETPLGSTQLPPELPAGTRPALPAPKAILYAALNRAERIGVSKLGKQNGSVFDPERFARELVVAMGEPEAKGWAELVADSVADVLASAETIEDLRTRMEALRETLTLN
jgi:HK97 family phage portal protein